jgi:hypothetical protein
MRFLVLGDRAVEISAAGQFGHQRQQAGSVAKFGIWAKTEKLIVIISRTYGARN